MQTIFHGFRLLFTIWAAGVFLLLLIITAPFFLLFGWIGGEHMLQPLLWLCRFIAWGLSFLLVIPFRFHRNPMVDKNRAYVLIANHRSNFDAPVAAASTWGKVRFLAKKELLRLPFLGSIFKRTAVSVDRTSPESRKQSMDAMAECLRKGESIFLFPEGTRNKTTDQIMIPFKDGAFRLAIEQQVPILPMIYTHTDRVMPNKPMLLRPGMVHVYYLDPVETKGLTLSDVTSLKDRIRNNMMDKYAALMQL
jgi:1-acyl-sn-glycerol-3-phosphate acyltransferase